MSKENVTKKILRIYLEPGLESDNAPIIFKKIYGNLLKHYAKENEKELLKSTLTIVSNNLLNENWEIQCRASIILRELLYYKHIPNKNDVIRDLITTIHRREIRPAREAALTIGNLLNTRPSDYKLPCWDGNYGPNGCKLRDIDQREYCDIKPPLNEGVLDDIDEDVIDEAIEELINNLDRKEYKRSKQWAVGKACAQAIGFIGYTRPELVKDAVPTIKDILSNGKGEPSHLLYALTCIGYSRPDLIGGSEFKQLLKENLDRKDLDPFLRLVIKVGIYKIGHSPSWIRKATLEGEMELEESLEKIFRFLFCPDIYNENIPDIFLRIVRKNPNNSIGILESELISILNGNTRSPDFPSNFMILLKKLSEEKPEVLEPLTKHSVDVFNKKSFPHYWHDNAAKMLINIFEENNEKIPENLQDNIYKILADDHRHSVIENLSRLKELINS